MKKAKNFYFWSSVWGFIAVALMVLGVILFFEPVAEDLTKSTTLAPEEVIGTIQLLQNITVVIGLLFLAATVNLFAAVRYAARYANA